MYSLWENDHELAEHHIFRKMYKRIIFEVIISTGEVPSDLYIYIIYIYKISLEDRPSILMAAFEKNAGIRKQCISS